MNVLQVSKYYYPTVGGIEQVVRSIAEGLNGDEFTVDVLAVDERRRRHAERIEGVRVRRVPSLATVLSTPLAPSFPVALAAAARDADVVHVHLPNPLAVVSALVALPSETPLVVTYHSDIVKQATALRLYAPVLRRFLARADRIVATSPRLVEHSDHLRDHRDRCSVVPLSVDPEAFRTEVESAGARSDADTDRPTLLFVGRLNYYKGVEYLVDAMRTVDADLRIVGDGDRRAALERRARDRGVEDDVEFLGTVSEDELRRRYAAADVFVLPSVEPSEAFGVVQLEAMASGTPVVNTDLPTGVPWVSVDGETGRTVPPRDADALAAAINDLLARPDRRERYARNAVERVERYFDRESMLDGMAGVYREVGP